MARPIESRWIFVLDEAYFYHCKMNRGHHEPLINVSVTLTKIKLGIAVVVHV